MYTEDLISDCIHTCHSMTMRLVNSCEGMKAVDRKNGIAQSTKISRSSP